MWPHPSAEPAAHMVGMTMNISAQAEQAREDHRKKKGAAGAGQFGAHVRGAPEAELAEPVDTARAQALEHLEKLLADHPEYLDCAREHMAGTAWRPDLVYVAYDDELRPEQLDAYLCGADDDLLEVEDMFRDSHSAEEALQDYSEELIGQRLDYLDDDDLAEELRRWIQEWDDSYVIEALVRGNGDVLMQLPAVEDDDLFGAALRDASALDDAQVRRGAIHDVFAGALEKAGIELTDENREAIESLIDENSLDAEYQDAEQWKLRLVTYTDPKPLAMSAYSDHGAEPRAVKVTDPYLLLVDRWNGRSHDVKLQGEFTTTLTEDRPARLDANLGYGSLDEIAGVVKSAYRADAEVTVAQPIPA